MSAKQRVYVVTPIRRYPDPPTLTMKHSDFESLPILGAGIGLRKQHFKELKNTDLPVGWLEIVPENFMNFGGFPQAMLDLCASRWPIVSHGVNLSIGSVDPLSEEYIERLRAVLERTQALWYSDHLCSTSIGGEYLARQASRIGLKLFPGYQPLAVTSPSAPRFAALGRASTVHPLRSPLYAHSVGARWHCS